jgi:hypothetical protein
MRWLLAIALCAVAGAAAAPVASGAAAKSCGRVVNPYPGTRYDGADLRRIRATGVTCHRARQVARGAHRKALRLTPPPSGVRHFRWHAWKVTGHIRGTTDSYVAKREGKRVRWRF